MVPPGTRRPLPLASASSFQSLLPGTTAQVQEGEGFPRPPNTQQDLVEEAGASRVRLPDFVGLCDLELVPIAL